MKNSKRWISLVLITLVFVSLVGCKGKVKNDENTLEIYSYLGGYDNVFLSKIAEKYEKANPGIKIKISGDSSSDKVNTILPAGPKNTTIDLMFSGESFFQILDQGPNVLRGYDYILEPLDDVYSHFLEDEGVTIEEKMNESYLDYHKFKVGDESHYFGISWANSLTGLIYNDTVFQSYGFQVPNTTDELIQLADEILTKNEIPFVFSTLTGYFEYVRETWHLQYEGAKNYDNFYKGVDNGRYSKNIFNQNGRLYSLEVIEEIVNSTDKRSHPNVNSMNYQQAQTKLLLQEGLMMPNGDWFENEVRRLNENNDNPVTFKFMRTPIISKIIDKTPTINDDITLSDVIDYVDGKSLTIPAGVSLDDVSVIEMARHAINQIGTNHNAVIPIYASAKELAKDFLKYMYSKEGLKIYQNETFGNSLPFKNDYLYLDEVSLSEFQKSKYTSLENGYFVNKNHPIVYRGGLSPYSGKRKIPEVLLAARNDKDKLTAFEIFEDEKAYYTDSVWNSLITRSKLK